MLRQKIRHAQGIVDLLYTCSSKVFVRKEILDGSENLVVLLRSTRKGFSLGGGREGGIFLSTPDLRIE